MPDIASISTAETELFQVTKYANIVVGNIFLTFLVHANNDVLV